MRLNWISLDNERPEEGQTVMVTDGEGVEVVTNGGSFWNVEYVHKECKYAYTHWLPIPRAEGGPDAKDFDSIELKPCPFCGEKDVRVEYEHKQASRVDGSPVWENVRYGIMCPSCFCRGAETYYMDDAINAWNRRDGP